jgi:hypothetical protein
MTKYGYGVSFWVEATDEESADEIVKAAMAKITSFEIEIEDGPFSDEDAEEE